ncbi:MAG: hypothetical protein J7J82_04390 [Staphylothermus sp.]|nr:hypothetical protein [Staphylothermus sp.]
MIREISSSISAFRRRLSRSRRCITHTRSRKCYQYNIEFLAVMSTIYGLGFIGIGVGLLGGNHPIGIIFSRLFSLCLIIGGQFVKL